MNDRQRDEQPDTDARLTRQCERAEELVTYLYGEANEREARNFGEHLSACASCRDELAAFGGVRGALNSWREEALRISPAVSFKHAASQTPDAAPARAPEARKRSALAALREFFALSPVWLQAGSVAAALAVCALAALTFARTEVRWDANGLAFRTGVRERLVEKRVEVPSVASGGETVAREELSALAAERDRLKAELESLRSERAGASGIVAASESKNRASASREGVPVGGNARRTTPRRAARSPRTEFARLDDEENLPRLFDLLSGVK